MADTIEIIQGTATTIEVAGLQGPQGPQGATGATGSAGQGVPSGGTTGQVLRKASGTNYDTEWAAAGSGSGSVTSVALAGTGLSISGSPITTSGTLTANVSYGTTAGTATQGNDSRIADIAASSITTKQGANSGGAGGTITMRGGITGTDGNGGNAGSINLRGSDDRGEGAFNGGSIDLSGFSGTGGSITSIGNSEGAGGSLNMSGNGFAGGSINTFGGTNGVGGSIDTSNDGGSINTRGTGSIGLGVSGTRTTLTGTATADRAISLPDASGTLATTAQAADYEVTDPAMGIILKSPNNTRWRLTINDDGTLSRAALALMTLLAFATSGLAQVRDMVTDANGNIVTGRTNALSFTNNVRFAPLTNADYRTAIIGTNGALTAGNPPSGAAANGALLTADGAGSSSFVVSRTVTRFTTNDQTKTNWGFNALAQSTNNDSQMGSIALDANSFYRVEYAVAWVATTNSGFNHGLAFSTNLSEFFQRSGVGQSANTTITAINVTTNGTTFSLPAGTAAATGGRYAVGGFIYLLTSSNANTMTYRWYPINNSADATTLVRSSMLSVTKMAP